MSWGWNATFVRKSIRFIVVMRVLKWLTAMLLIAALWGIPILRVGVDGAPQKPGGNPGKGKGKQSPSPSNGVPVKFHEDHRSIQWCVNGFDEPEFHQYPWSEFVPLLQRKYYSNFKANERYTYTISLLPIKMDIANLGFAPGSQGNLHQRAHFTFNVKLRKEFESGVNLEYYNTSMIEGLIVQANFAPYGIGLPMGQFIHPKEFNCMDCEKPIGIPIACRRRTHMHIVHPTIMVYHHKMKILEEEKNRKRTYCYNKYIPSQCILTGFDQNDEYNSSGVIGTAGTGGAVGTPFSFLWDTIYAPYKWQPFPGMAVECQRTEDCMDKLKEWFSADCCTDKSGGVCNAQSTSSGNATAPTPPPPPPPKRFCPNVAAPAGQDVYENPLEQTLDKPVFECRPFEITACRPIGYPTLPRWEELYEEMQQDWTKTTPQKLPPPPANSPPTFDPFDPAMQCCMGASPGSTTCPPVPPNAPPGPPPGQIVCPKEDPATGTIKTECVSRVVLPINRDVDPWVENFLNLVPASECSNILVKDKQYGITNEVHGNFVWYVPPCRGTKVKVRFRFLAVHSFHRGIYSIQETDYYELKSGALSGKFLNPHIPSPLFKGFSHTCETTVTAPEYLYSSVPATDQDTMDFSRSYDACVQNITGTKYVNDQICPDGIPKFIPDTGRRKRGKPAPTTYANALVPKCNKNNPADSDNIVGCEYTCPTLAATTPEYVSTPSNKIIKRTLHGGINIVTNFCIMPICVFVARFYKETYNMQSFKGQKTWYWMHMIGAGGSTVFMYMGYFTDRLVDESDAHLVYGNLYIICLGLSYITSWMRHKNRWISMVVESIHSVCGYCCFILALFCVTNAKHYDEPISDAVKYVVYVAIASLVIFYVGMTIHICSMDRKFGMKPARWHFPSVEARFDDLPVPGRKIRMILIYLVLIINLPLTLSTLFL